MIKTQHCPNCEATKQEVERLNALITATADHWMALQFKHPIQWEGAIDSAMAAACAEIEKHEAFRQEVSFALKTFKDGNMHTMHDYLLEPFIIPAPKPDPLVEAYNEALPSTAACHGQETVEHICDKLRAALDARGYEIREKNDD
ncbi:hypothetical protein UFOVP714_11 [uncultured Caudovirales phage]|uniref:Uncharacterized protein n=1 Tax=uncultured Caudovirales phage TaxID=2100421 RepID=A0A6J5PCY5_9CAUD|nr:hypothetical protein UFOVP714_11 [uncultured Caudovirales phage]CAB4167766.1 hypothetical protein UFOVP864_49 [uncultured Caudovirales phage]